MFCHRLPRSLPVRPAVRLLCLLALGAGLSAASAQTTCRETNLTERPVLLQAQHPPSFAAGEDLRVKLTAFAPWQAGEQRVGVTLSNGQGSASLPRALSEPWRRAFARLDNGIHLR